MPDPTPPPPRDVLDRPTVLPPRLTAGDTVGRFRLEELLGRGGMGEVWKAADPNRKAAVVVKVLPVELAASPGEIARLRDSFERVSKLHHEHICPVYDLTEDPRCGPYLVMKHVPGEPLSVYRRKYVKKHGAFPLTEVIRILRPIAAALDYAHAQRVIHRDVKPANILIQPDGTNPQVVDFGLAAEIQRSVSRVSQARFDTSGTLAYMAPEQWRGRPQDGATDQYALAALAYELLHGDPPFDHPEPQVLRLCVLNDPPPEVPGVSAGVSAVVGRALAKTGPERFPSCTAFVSALADPPKVVARPAAAGGVPFAAPVRRRLVPRLVAAAAVGAAAWVGYQQRDRLIALASGPPAPTVAAATPAIQAPAAAASSVAAAPAQPPSNPPPAPDPQPPKPNVPPVIPNPPTDLLGAVEQKRAVDSLAARLDRLTGPVTGWRKQLAVIDPADTPEAEAVRIRLLEARDALSEAAEKYGAVRRDLDAKPPTTGPEYTGFEKQITALEADPVRGKTTAAWLAQAATDQTAFTRATDEHRRAREAELAGLTESVRKAGRRVIQALEAADTKGFDVTDAATKEARADLVKRQKELGGLATTLLALDRELGSKVPPESRRLADLTARYRALTLPDDAWRDATVKAADVVRHAAKAGRAAFEDRQRALGRADEEAQWFVCTDHKGRAIYFEELGKRRKMTYQGKTPFRSDDPQRTMEFCQGYEGRDPDTNNCIGALEVDVFNEKKVLEKVFIDSHRSADPVAQAFANQKKDSWRFAYEAGRERQKYIPFNDRDPDAVKAKQAEMCAALAALLSQKFPGLGLTADEVTITWKRVPDGDEKKVTLENMWGGFQIAVKVPKALPPGLAGTAFPEFRALRDQALQAFGSGAATPPSSAEDPAAPPDPVRGSKN